MNKLSAEKDALIDRMLCLAYPIRVIREVAQVSRNSVLVRRSQLVYGRGLCFVSCPCGKPVIDWDTDHFHDIEPCERRVRRSRLLLSIIRRKRVPKTKIKLSAVVDQYVSADRPVIPASKQALRDMLAEAVRNTKSP